MMRPTTIIKFQEWTLLCDPEATAQAYAQLDEGGAEECGCAYCRNFAAVRHTVYPQCVLDLLADLGVDYRKEVEVIHFFRERSDRHYYGWWLHAVGRVLSGPSPESNRCFAMRQVEGNFGIGFHENRALAAESFTGKQLIQIECDAYLTWALEEEEPD